MTAPEREVSRALLVFTDLDGTLLNHDDYDYRPALPAIATLQERGVPLVIVTSKTRPEIEALRRQLGVRDPFAPENGAAVIWPPEAATDLRFASDDTRAAQVFRFGPSYAELRKALAEVRDRTGLAVRGFGDVDAETVADWTGLSPADAALAKARMGTEPIHVPADPEVRARLRAALAAAGIATTEGGRFVHAIGPFDKGTAVRDMLARYRAAWPEIEVRSGALGDSPNDAPMLEAVDYPVVVPRAHGAPLQLDHPGAFTAPEPGARGFAMGVDHILRAFAADKAP